MFTQDLADRFRAHETLGEAHSANLHLCAPRLFNSGTLKDISDSDRDLHSPLEVFTKTFKAYLNFHPFQSSSVSFSDWRSFFEKQMATAVKSMELAPFPELPLYNSVCQAPLTKLAYLSPAVFPGKFTHNFEHEGRHDNAQIAPNLDLVLG